MNDAPPGAGSPSGSERTRACVDIPLSLRSRLARAFDRLPFSSFRAAHQFALEFFAEVVGPIALGSGDRIVIERVDGSRQVVNLPYASTTLQLEDLDEGGESGGAVE